MTGTVGANTVFKPSITREISPPEAMFLSGRRDWPGLGENKNSTLSAPVGPRFSSSISTATAKRTALKPSGRISSVMRAESFWAACKRFSCSSRASFKRVWCVRSTSASSSCSRSSPCWSWSMRARSSSAVRSTSWMSGPYLAFKRLIFSCRESILSNASGSKLMSSLYEESVDAASSSVSRAEFKSCASGDRFSSSSAIFCSSRSALPARDVAESSAAYNS